MIGLLAFFTRPDTGSLWWSVLLVLATLALLLYAGLATRPPRLAASAPSAELGNESPAVASLLTNGFVVTPAAAVATLLDLVARGWLRIEHTEHEVVLLTDRRGREGDALKGYEQQVLNHIHKMTAGTLTGVSGAGVEIAGLRLPRRWWRRFTRSVVADARRLRLTKRRWNVARRRPAGRDVRARRAHVVAGGPVRRARSRSSTRWRHGASRSPSASPSWSSPSGSSSASARTPSGRRTTVSCGPSTGSACGRGWRRGASRARRRSPPTARAGLSPTPPRSASPSGPPTSCRSCPRTTAWRGATPPASGTSCASGTRSGPATAATRRSCSCSASSSAAG